MKILELEDFLRNHSDNDGILELQDEIKNKQGKIETLEDMVAEFEDFLKQNPDVKELRDLKHQINIGNRRIRELENWIERNGDVRIEKTRIMELEEMVTHLEDYVKSHDVDSLKRQLQDREDRIMQLLEKIETLEKKLLRQEPIKSTSDDITRNIFSEKDTKIKEMKLEISEKDNRIQEYEKRTIEWQNKVDKLVENMKIMRKELSEYEAEDIGVLKEEIRVRDEKVRQLENEIDSLERAFGERLEDLEHIEELVHLIKEKEERECQLEKDLVNEKQKSEDLKEALRESIKIVSQGQNNVEFIEKSKKNAVARVDKLEQRIVSMQSASAIRCHTCRPLLLKLSKYEKKLERLINERKTQLTNLHHANRKALRVELSEKDAHLALLELSGIKTEEQSDQAKELRKDREKIIDQLKDEDKKCIELTEESETSDSSQDSLPLLTKILEPARDDYSDYQNGSKLSKPLTPNGHASEDGETIQQRIR